MRQKKISWSKSYESITTQFALGAVQGAGLLLLSGCEKAFNGLQQNRKFLSLLESAEGANQRLQRLADR